MEAEEHKWFTGVVKDFKVLEVALNKVASQIDSLRNRVVEYENKVANLEKAAMRQKDTVEVLDKESREKRIIMDSNTAGLAADLERRRNDVATHEARLQVREAQLREQQNKLDLLLSSAEKTVGKKVLVK